MTRSSRMMARGAAQEHRVVEDQELRIEQRRQVAAGALGQPFADLAQLRVRALAGAIERAQFVVDPFRGNRETDDVGMRW